MIRHANNQKGIAIIEIVLMMIVGLSVGQLVIKGLKDMNFAQTLIASPWPKLQGMIECGIWAPCRNQAGLHPNVFPRFVTNEGLAK